MAARDPESTPASPLTGGRSSGGAAVAYRAADRRWWLWLPCDRCGGAELPLSAPDTSDRPSAGTPGTGWGGLPSGRVDRGGRGACAACETRRRRESSDIAPRSVWYDTELLEWVLCLSTPDGAGVMLPLGIDSYDASLADVYRAAGDIAYSGDDFDTAARDSRRESRGDERR